MCHSNVNTWNTKSIEPTSISGADEHQKNRHFPWRKCFFSQDSGWTWSSFLFLLFLQNLFRRWGCNPLLYWVAPGCSVTVLTNLKSIDGMLTGRKTARLTFPACHLKPSFSPEFKSKRSGVLNHRQHNSCESAARPDFCSQNYGPAINKVSGDALVIVLLIVNGGEKKRATPAERSSVISSPTSNVHLSTRGI